MYHCSGAQGIFGPDGIFYDWYDEPLGRDSDRFFMRDSMVNSILQGSCAALGLLFWVYCDKGYTRDTYVRCAAHSPVPVSVQEHHDNWLMSSGRVSVEWGFGKIYARCPILKRPHLLKLQAMDVAKHIRVAVLLTNAHTCPQQSQTGKHFVCTTPTLSAYFLPAQ
jgi:hypothetical protein